MITRLILFPRLSYLSTPVSPYNLCCLPRRNYYCLVSCVGTYIHLFRIFFISSNLYSPNSSTLRSDCSPNRCTWNSSGSYYRPVSTTTRFMVLKVTIYHLLLRSPSPTIYCYYFIRPGVGLPSPESFVIKQNFFRLCITKPTPSSLDTITFR